MTETVMAKEVVDALKPDYVTPLVAWLCHESCSENGSLFEVGAGFITKHRFQRTKGHSFDFDNFTPEEVKKHWDSVTDFSKATIPESINDTLAEAMNNVERNAALKGKKTSGAALKSNELFEMMSAYLATIDTKDLIAKVAAVYQFDIWTTKGEIAQSWAIDLKTAPGSVKKGAATSPDATFTISDEDYMNVASGKLNPQMAFMQGKMKIKGNMGKATKFTPDLFPPPTPENYAKFKAAKL